MQNFKTEFPLLQMEREACGCGMKREVQGAVARSKGGFPRAALLGIPKQTPLVQERNQDHLPGAIKYASPGHFYYLSLCLLMKP